MIRYFIVTLLVGLTFSAMTAGAANLDVVALRSGKTVPVLGISETTLRGSDEPVLVLRYRTDLDFSDKKALAREAEEVWGSFRETVDQRGFKAAVVEAKDNHPSPGTSRVAGWTWKKDSDGKWHVPDGNDHLRVPKDVVPIKPGAGKPQ